MKQLTFEELTKAPDGIPAWFGEVLAGIKLADHLGDVWDVLVAHAPDERTRVWIESVADAEYDAESETYSVDTP